jgi:hypothetical protein
VDHTARHLNSSSHQITADAPPVWAFIIIRPQRDRATLSADLAAGDKLAHTIISGISSWLQNWRRNATAPVCISCEKPLRPPQPPRAFCIATSDDPKEAGQNVIIGGVCKRCAAKKTDAELLMVAAKDASAAGGDMLGFGLVGGAPPSTIQ